MPRHCVRIPYSKSLHLKVHRKWLNSHIPWREIIFAQPRYGENPKPDYPSEAREKGYEGETVLRVEVLSNGHVGKVRIKKSSGPEILDWAALHAVKQWKFIPAKEGEVSIPAWVNVPIKFQLR